MTQTCDHFGIPTDVPFGELDEEVEISCSMAQEAR
ncbi:MAG: hypothetical protein Ct9H90mP1_0740 [Methanobacteriota archaeon]|nr:MAG: hypothetical protein Ct9H90mP1_0740 [Euryarchaeota archaeon]